MSLFLRISLQPKSSWLFINSLHPQKYCLTRTYVLFQAHKYILHIQEITFILFMCVHHSPLYLRVFILFMCVHHAAILEKTILTLVIMIHCKCQTRQNQKPHGILIKHIGLTAAFRTKTCIINLESVCVLILVLLRCAECRVVLIP